MHIIHLFKKTPLLVSFAWLLPWLLTLGSGCTTLEKLEPPSVALVGITPRSSTGVLPAFDIQLKLSNPNDIAIPLRSARYELFLNNSKVVTGSADDLPTLPAHGEAIVAISAVPEAEGAMALVGQFLIQQPQTMKYQFRAELDPAITLPTIHVERTGQIKLPQMNR